MYRPTLLTQDSFQRSLWKNGLGHTDQIAIEPPTGDLRLGNYLWRISSASIANASDFSIFPDHDRGLIILSGAGVRLIHRDDENDFNDTIDLPPFEPYEFPGDIRSRCELLGGPVKDLSVFFRKGEVNASVEAVRFEMEQVWEWSPRGAWNFIFAARGGFEIAYSEEETETLLSGNAMRATNFDGREPESYPVVAHSPDSVLISITLWKN